MKERVFAAVREMKREQWLICGLAGLLLLVIAAPVKQKEQKKTQEKTTVSQTQEQTDDQIRQSYEKQLESVLTQVEGVQYRWRWRWNLPGRNRWKKTVRRIPVLPVKKEIPGRSGAVRR